MNYPVSDWLTEFLYLLLRQGLPAGELERIVWEVEQDQTENRASKEDASKNEMLYTNGWLATYAHHLAERLRKM